MGNMCLTKTGSESRDDDDDDDDNNENDAYWPSASDKRDMF